MVAPSHNPSKQEDEAGGLAMNLRPGELYSRVKTSMSLKSMVRS